MYQVMIENGERVVYTDRMSDQFRAVLGATEEGHLSDDTALRQVCDDLLAELAKPHDFQAPNYAASNTFPHAALGSIRRACEEVRLLYAAIHSAQATTAEIVLSWEPLD